MKHAKILMLGLTFLLAATVTLGAVMSLAQKGGDAALQRAQTMTVPQTMTYQGKLVLQGQPYSGTAYMKFAIIDASGTASYWSNDASSVNGSEPTSSWLVTVKDGVFTVQLGESPMVLLSSDIFTGERKLRIWVSQTGTGSYTQLTPDHTLSSVPYAFNADMLNGKSSDSYRQRYQNIIDVAPQNADAVDIPGAVALVSNSSATNTYLIRVAPGVYAGNATLPPYVHLRGSGIDVTVITASVQGGGVLTMQTHTELSELSVVAKGQGIEAAAVTGQGEGVQLHNLLLKNTGAHTLYGFSLVSGSANLADFEVYLNGGDDSKVYGLSAGGGILNADNGKITAIGGARAVMVRNSGENTTLLKQVSGRAAAITETIGAENINSQLTLQNVRFNADGSNMAYALYAQGGDLNANGSIFNASGGMAYGAYIPLTITGVIEDVDFYASGYTEGGNGVYNGQNAQVEYRNVRINSAGGSPWGTVGMSVYKSTPMLHNVSIYAGTGDSEKRTIGLELSDPLPNDEWYLQDLFISSKAITRAYGVYESREDSGDIFFNHAVIRTRSYTAQSVYLYGSDNLHFENSDLSAESTGQSTNEGEAIVLQHVVSAPLLDLATFYIGNTQLQTPSFTGNHLAITGTVHISGSLRYTRTTVYAGASLMDGAVGSVDAACINVYSENYQALDAHCR